MQKKKPTVVHSALAKCPKCAADNFPTAYMYSTCRKCGFIREYYLDNNHTKRCDIFDTSKYRVYIYESSTMIADKITGLQMTMPVSIKLSTTEDQIEKYLLLL